TYRLGLENRAQRLGVAANILFHDRFVTQTELAEFLAAADVYITPYLKAEQSTSGTLAYAVGAGKAVISTPYSHALEMLADDRGIIVPWRDPAAIAREVVGLMGDEERRLAMAGRAAAYGSDMVWPAVARRHHDSLERACADHAERRRTVFQARTLAERPAERPETNLEHVELMTDSTGILQHAVFNVPRYDDGYCLDDNARALLLAALVEEAGTADIRTTRALASRYLAFVSHAFVEPLNRFRNFMTYSRQWVEEIGSEDSHGRALWALGTVVGRSHDPGRQNHARALFHRALEAVSGFNSPRAWSFALLGIDDYLRAFQGDSNVEALRESLGERLLGLHRRTSHEDWPWFEDRVTYENARLSQAMLATGARTHRPEMTEVGLRSLEWLVSIQTSTDGYFAPVGSNGFHVRGGPRAAFDQQPIEACAMIAACLEARRVTGEGIWTVRARQAFGWFLGHNHLQQSLYDAATGGCRDGIHADRLNANQGAESTLSFQLSLLDMLAVDLASIQRPVLQEAMA
ncbi:MAG: group 1 glycosyl transferase, partial [bacterium]